MGNSQEFYVNIHCHPSMKPFSRSWDKGKINSINRKNRNSIWYYNPPSLVDKLLNYLVGFTKFSQSDFSSSSYGQMRVMVASLYPIEKSFCLTKLGGECSDLPLNFITEIGTSRINHIQSSVSQDYFEDLNDEYNFLLELDGKEVMLEGNQKFKYVLACSYSQLQAALLQPNTIVIILSFEGAHALGCGIDYKLKPANLPTLLARLAIIKNWKYKPLFITFAHHFYNELCGHAVSLGSLLGSVADQKDGLDTSFTPLGLEILDGFLDNTNGKRILIDIKHMSRQARKDYFLLLSTNYKDEKIPVIVSHGCVVGNGSNQQLFFQGDINFYDDELIVIAESGGLFGIQLDERRIASTAELKKAKGNLQRKKILFDWSRLVWRQMQHIAEVLDDHGLFSWGTTCLGTDYDGIIDPINGFWTHEDMPDLDTYLLMHAHNYLAQPNALKQARNKTIHEEEIVSRVMSGNAMEFFKKYL